ncbi:S-adenosyl-L-methionine-dependent tRNA 4-demethylwyosine synthase TYW1B isoform X5 [Petromyzon marinus]|uniref:S-adenosyl-L-methionine-dependent tRNA 4-demethylwyosine synthase TYW1B isoform X5 n=1 Tax=Petromyzon marinus TaxID=7757 RepID=UPI003F709B92
MRESRPVAHVRRRARRIDAVRCARVDLPTLALRRELVRLRLRGALGHHAVADGAVLPVFTESHVFWLLSEEPRGPFNRARCFGDIDATENSMLRGRGGCYKHAFYGIESHRCMEATPSLACANKCIFCWRHHTNPVGTEWRWKMDPPELILQEALENHMAMIRQFKGVPGVRPERFQEGLVAQHCALSLVGEPIMYPEINRFLRLLHRRGLSSFVVTNAQFPDEIRTLEPVTQLYVSVDASTRESLRRIDRPLFKDFWTRFLDSLRALSEKGQRTVYRLTLVKAWNVEEVTAYANLVALGNPDFIEVKGVTYCGESSASSLTMANVPWHEEVVGFVRQLAAMLPDYELACEHEHSNCLLLAHKRFKRHGEWWTWINYTRFQELARAHAESGGAAPFTADDYAARTPRWALFGSRERGFDPADTRFFRKNRPKDISGC